MTELSDILPVELDSGKSGVNGIAGIGALLALLSHVYEAIDLEFCQHYGGPGGMVGVARHLCWQVGQAYEPVKIDVALR